MRRASISSSTPTSVWITRAGRMPKPRRSPSRNCTSTRLMWRRSRKCGAAAASSPPSCWISPPRRWRAIHCLPTSPGGCPTRARAAGRSRRRSMRVSRRMCSPPRCMRVSNRAVGRSSPTRCSRPCVWDLAVTTRPRLNAMSSATQEAADALVLFGATGDLCHRKIFPSLYQLVRRARLTVPVIGVAKAGWNRDQLIERLRDSLKHYVKDAESAVVERLVALVQYVDGDYGSLETFQQLRKLLGTAQHPLHYLAIPPSMFPIVVTQLAAAGCDKGARLVIEKPFGRDLASAHALNQTLHKIFDERSIFRIDHYLGKE